MTDADATGEGGDADPAGDPGDADTTGDAGRPGDAGSGPVVDLDWEGSGGLLPVVAQDAGTGEVLMLAYVSPEALERTRETGLAHYHSRSRDELWKKGGTSGHVQRIDEVRVDCDGDALLYRVHQEGGACHTGFQSCFHRDLSGEEVGERVFDPDEVYDDD
ncbi:phosphoribosyl-AMP cyclohydrolase [Halobacteriales archaeon QS_8_69_26]|nr:MAG: phosphoribosyl-AMP cyclohydrolase [Halobacteriales archaeon QS_8_69_26]